MSEREQAEMLPDNIPEKNLHIVIALMRELTDEVTVDDSVSRKQC